MFVGHYAASFAGKAAAPRVPLWAMLLAAQLVDVAWGILVLAGVERVRLDAALASNPLVLEHMPYTHSLLGTLAFAALAGGAAASLPRLGGTRRAGLAVGAVVLSHWVLDLAVHRPDLTLWGGGPRLGLALWERPLPAYALELALLAGGGALYLRRCRPGPAARRRVEALLLGLVLVQTAVAFGPVPGAVPALVVSVLGVFAAVAWAGAAAEAPAAPA